jgi:hypothetical protein
MKKFISLVVILGFMGMLLSLPSKSFSNDTYNNQIADSSKVLNTYEANNAVLKTLHRVLLEAQKSQYAPDKTVYALDALKFTMQLPLDPSALIGFIQPLIDTLIKAPIELLKSVFPMIQSAVETILSSITSKMPLENPLSSRDVMMLQELQNALDEAIQSNYEPEKVSYALNQLEKVVTQDNGLDVNQLLGLVSPIIDVLKTFVIAIPTQIIGILSELMGTLDTLTGALSGLGAGSRGR